MNWYHFVQLVKRCVLIHILLFSSAAVRLLSSLFLVVNIRVVESSVELYEFDKLKTIDMVQIQGNTLVPEESQKNSPRFKYRSSSSRRLKAPTSSSTITKHYSTMDSSTQTTTVTRRNAAAAARGCRFHSCRRITRIQSQQHNATQLKREAEEKSCLAGWRRDRRKSTAKKNC